MQAHQNPLTADYASMQGLDVSHAGLSINLPTQGRGTHTMFFAKAVPLVGQFTEAGMPKTEVREYCKIVIAGDRNSNVVHQLKPAYRDRFLAKRGLTALYQAWKNSMETINPDAVDGTPIDRWPQISRDQAEALKYNHVYTIEALAQLHDGALSKIGANGITLRHLARIWLDQAKKGMDATSAAMEVENLTQQVADERRKNEQMAEMLRQMQAQVNALTRGAAPGAASADVVGGSGEAGVVEVLGKDEY